MVRRFGAILALATVVAGGAAPAAAEPPSVREVAVLVFDGADLLDFAGPAEVFASVRVKGERAFHVFTVAEAMEPVISKKFLKIVPEYTLENCPQAHIVVVPGGRVPHGNDRLKAWIRAQVEQSELVMSVCNGAILLAESGILRGLEATTHAGFLERLVMFEPTARVYSNRRFVDNGRVLTTAGISAGIDGALHVVTRVLGDAVARETARFMEYSWRPEEIEKLHAHPGHVPANVILGKLIDERGVDGALAEYEAMRRPPRAGGVSHSLPTEIQINDYGYAALNAGRIEKSVAVFRFLVAAFPDSANPYDSLSEAYEATGDEVLALTYAREALARLDWDSQLGDDLRERVRTGLEARLKRLQKVEKALSNPRYVCPPCGELCDEQEFLLPGRCPNPHCRMSLRQRGEFDNADPVVSPDGSRIAFLSNRGGDWEIFVMENDGSRQRKLVDASLSPRHVSWAPDGRSLIFEARRDGDGALHTIRADGSGLSRVGFAGGARHPAWSPDGSRIACTVGEWPQVDVCLVTPEGRVERNLTADNEGRDFAPAWSPDGKRIAFTATREGSTGTFIMNVDGTAIRFLHVGRMPSWSPDGIRVAFQARRDGLSRIFTIGVDGTGSVQLSNGKSNDWRPSWSSDGKWIYFCTDRNGPEEIFVMDNIGQNARQLTEQLGSRAPNLGGRRRF